MHSFLLSRHQRGQGIHQRGRPLCLFSVPGAGNRACLRPRERIVDCTFAGKHGPYRWYGSEHDNAWYVFHSPKP